MLKIRTAHGIKHRHYFIQTMNAIHQYVFLSDIPHTREKRTLWVSPVSVFPVDGNIGWLIFISGNCICAFFPNVFKIAQTKHLSVLYKLSFVVVFYIIFTLWPAETVYSLHTAEKLPKAINYLPSILLRVTRQKRSWKETIMSTERPSHCFWVNIDMTPLLTHTHLLCSFS